MKRLNDPGRAQVKGLSDLPAYVAHEAELKQEIINFGGLDKLTKPRIRMPGNMLEDKGMRRSQQRSLACWY